MALLAVLIQLHKIGYLIGYCLKTAVNVKYRMFHIGPVLNSTAHPIVLFKATDVLSIST